MKRCICLLLFLGMATLPLSSFARTRTTRVHHARTTKVQESAKARKNIVHLQHGKRVAATRTVLVRGRNGKLHRVVVRRRYYEHFTGDSFAVTDLTADDVTAGEDPIGRRAGTVSR